MSLIGERVLEVHDGSQRKIVVKVWTPICEQGKDYRCDYSFEGVEDRIINRSVWGVDSFQAIQLTFKVINATLEGYNRSEFAGKLYWLDPQRPVNDFGFC